MYKILSLDGGGIRGRFTAESLLALEMLIGKPLYQAFDLIIGNSTGAIEACLLACGYSVQEIIDFYTGEDAKQIFKPYLIQLFRKSKFNADNINAVLLKHFQDKQLKDSLVDIMAIAYDAKARQVLTFSNKNDNYKNLYFRDVARASSAAPLYFTPHEFNNYRCIDGGMAANNPSTRAFSYIKNLKKQGPDLNIVIASFGTGSFEQELKYDDLCISSPVSFICNIIDCFMDGSACLVEEESKELLGDNYFRFQALLPKELSTIDNVTTKNLNGLRDLAQTCINNQWQPNLLRLKDVLLKGS